MNGTEEEEIEERIEELQGRADLLTKFRARLRAADKEELKRLLGPWMSAARSFRTRERGAQVSYLIRLGEAGDIEEYRIVKRERGGYVQAELRSWADIYFSIGSDAFLSYDELVDAAEREIRVNLDYMEHEIESEKEYREALTGEVAV